MGSGALAKLGLVVFGLVATVILLEGVLQVGSLFVADPLGPGTTSWTTGDNRFLALGDSNTYGVWLPDRERDAYPPQLERIWNSQGRAPIEVLNLGYPGTNSSRLLGLYPEFMEAFAPDVVLVMIGVNDFWTEPVAFDEGPGDGLLASLKRHSRLYKGLYILLRRSGADALEVSDKPDSSFERGEGTIRSGEHEFTLGWNVEIGKPDEVEAALRENLRQLVVLSRLSSARLVLMTYPGRFRYYGVVNRVIRAIAQESGVPLIDHELVFRPLCPEMSCPEWLYEDQHPRAVGYRLVGETIAARLPELLR